MLLFLRLCFLSVLTFASAEFFAPPPSGVDLSVNTPYVARWSCEGCGTNPISLLLLYPNASGDGSYISQTLLDSVTGPDLGNYTLDASVLDPLPESNSYLSLRFKDWKINSGDMYKLNAQSSNSATVPPSTSVSGVSAPSASTPNSTSLSGRASQTGSAPLSASTPPSGSPSQSNTTLRPSGASSAPTSSIVSNNNQAPKLGIVLGIGLGLGVPFLLLIGGITGFLLFRKRSRSHRNTTPELPDVTTDYPSFEVAGKEVVPELSGGVWRHELRVTERPVEMQG